MEEDPCYLQNDDQTVVTWPDKVDISLLCRICANSSEYLIPIFDGEGMENELELKIKKHLPIEISKEDQLPMSLCYQCASTLIAWHDLTLGCIDADRRLRFLMQNSYKEEINNQSKIEEDDEGEHFRGASDIEIEFEEEVTTTPSTSTQIHLEDSNPLIKVKKKSVVKPTSIKQESEKKQNELTKGETKENTIVKESLLKERCPITTKVIHYAQLLDSKTSTSADLKMASDNDVIYNKQDHRKAKLYKSNTFGFSKKDNTHTDNVEKTAQYLCEYCGQSFHFQSQYSKHMVKHKITPMPKSYLSHQPKHLKEKPFPCHLCGKRLVRISEHLKRAHFRINSHDCEICDLSFARKGSLEDHQRSYHPNEKPFICHSCGKSFRTKASIRRHSKTHY